MRQAISVRLTPSPQRRRQSSRPLALALLGALGTLGRPLDRLPVAVGPDRTTTRLGQGARSSERSIDPALARLVRWVLTYARRASLFGLLFGEDCHE